MVQRGIRDFNRQSESFEYMDSRLCSRWNSIQNLRKITNQVFAKRRMAELNTQGWMHTNTWDMIVKLEHACMTILSAKCFWLHCSRIGCLTRQCWSWADRRSNRQQLMSYDFLTYAKCKVSPYYRFVRRWPIARDWSIMCMRNIFGWLLKYSSLYMGGCSQKNSLSAVYILTIGW